MADALVQELNKRGYQPLFLPRTGVEPPELYSWARSKKKLARRGHLSNYLPRGTLLESTLAKAPDIERHATSSKNQSAAISFLKHALACIGIDGAPSLNLKFVGQVDISFRFTDVRLASFDGMDRVVRESLDFDAIPPDYFAEGDLHVAYEYLYAKELLLSRSDQRAFEHDISASVQTHFNVGLKGKVEMRSDTTLSFASTTNERVAFAARFGQLVRQEGAWYFYPDEGKMGGSDRRDIIPARGVVLDTEPGP